MIDNAEPKSKRRKRLPERRPGLPYRMAIRAEADDPPPVHRQEMLNDELFEASLNGDADKVIAYLREGADPSPELYIHAFGPIQTAHAHGNFEAVKALLEIGRCDPNRRNPDTGRPLLHDTVTDIVIASTAERRNDKLETARALLDAGADQSLPDRIGSGEFGHSALWNAVVLWDSPQESYWRENCLEAVQLLMDKGGVVDDETRESALDTGDHRLIAALGLPLEAAKPKHQVGPAQEPHNEPPSRPVARNFWVFALIVLVVAALAAMT